MAFRHGEDVRCPDCGNCDKVWTFNEPLDDVFSSGRHEAQCSKCGKLYEFKTEVEYTFVSPEPTP